MGGAILSSREDFVRFSSGMRGGRQPHVGILQWFKQKGMRKITNPERIAYMQKMQGLGYELKDNMWSKKVKGKEVFVTDGMQPPVPTKSTKSTFLTDVDRDKKIMSLLQELFKAK